jgi:hypothetical protein
LFPENYEFLVIEEHRGLITGEYEFANLDDQIHFNKLEQNDVLAYPVEKKKFLALPPLAGKQSSRCQNYGSTPV